MSEIRDADFVEPAQKHLHAYDPSHPEEQSQAAIVSVVSGVLSFFVLPIIGGIVAIVAGHQALRRIRESRGRVGGSGAAKVGLTLGYGNLATGLVFLALVGWFATRVVPQAATATTMKISTPVPVESPERGVKMANELSKRDFEVLKLVGLEHEPEDIIVFCNLSKSASVPELALLTTKEIIYLKEGRKTEFELKDIAAVKTANELGTRTDSQGNSAYPIEAVRKNGTRMRILITPQSEGPSFSDALTSAWKAAQGDAAPRPTSP